MRAAAAEFDTLRVLAVRIDFADDPRASRPPARDSLFIANELKHLADYFRGASRGRMEMAWTLAPARYTLPKTMAYYGQDEFEEARVVELMASVIDSADADVDFSRYQTIMLIHPGPGQETDLAGNSRDQIWSSFYDVSDIDAAFPDSSVSGLATADLVGGVPFLVDNFSVVPDDASQDFAVVGTLGIWAFEICSRVGLLPLFDSTPPGVSDSQGVGNFCVMAYGLFNVDGFVPSFPCAFNRLIAGWIDPVVVQPEPQEKTLRLADVNTGAEVDTTCIKIPITGSEYYLVVNRVHDANFDSLFTFTDFDSNLVPNNTDSLGGAEFDFFLTDITNPRARRFDPDYGFNVLRRYTGSGIYVWHVDEGTLRETIASGFLPNDFVDRKSVDLEEADGVQDLDGGGLAAFALGSHFDSFRAGDGNATAFGPKTKPNTKSNGGARTGFLIDDISKPGHVMTLSVSVANNYEEIRRNWTAQGRAQPATPVDLAGLGQQTIVVLADTGRVYAFDRYGAEYVDRDGDEDTIDPFITVPDAVWTGPPAFGDLDFESGHEIVAAAKDGRVYAWKGTGEPLTGGALYTGFPLAAPPLLLDVDDNGRPDVAVVESLGDSLYVGFVSYTGEKVFPTGDPFATLWPVSVQGQYAAPLALAWTENVRETGKIGVVFSYVDTVTSTIGVSYTPASYSLVVPTDPQPPAVPWLATFDLRGDRPPETLLPSAPAVGDLDGDSHDEIVMTFPDGRVAIFEDDAGQTGSVKKTIVRLRGTNPSAPALGDIDGDGTLEIAVWDDEYMYLLKSNGRDATNWPQRIMPVTVGEQPPGAVERGLESPVIADVDGDGAIEVLYALQDGIIFGFEKSGAPVSGFPRVGPAGVTATPTVASLAGGAAFSLVTVGAIDAFRRIDTVTDSVVTSPEVTLSIQTLPGSTYRDRWFWALYQGDIARTGRAVKAGTLRTESRAVRGETFMVYPNPVAGKEVHARVSLNRRALVRVEIFNLEGERSFEREYEANPNGLIDTPFDEIIDVTGLSSGVYFMRLHIDSAGEIESLVKPFAVRR